MNISDTCTFVIQTLIEIQHISGRDPVTIDITCVPLDDLQDFDSFNSIEATVALSERLEKDIPLNENLCWDNIQNKPRNILEIAQTLLNYPNIQR